MVIRPEDKPPKKAATPWIQFYTKYLAEQVKEIKDGQKVPVAELVRNAAVLWKTLSEEEKRVCSIILL